MMTVMIKFWGSVVVSQKPFKTKLNPYYTVYFKSYYQLLLQTLTPAPTFKLKLLV